jgi:hypothetical protein
MSAESRVSRPFPVSTSSINRQRPPDVNYLSKLDRRPGAAGVKSAKAVRVLTLIQVEHRHRELVAVLIGRFKAAKLCVNASAV